MDNENKEYVFGAGSDQENGEPQSYGEPRSESQYGDQSYGENQTYGEEQSGSQYESQSYGQSENAYGGQSYGQSENAYGGQSYGQSENTYGIQSYGQPDQQYGGQTYGQGMQSFGNQSYGQNYGQQGYGMGALPVDKNGKPLQNRFGMKITFSILEILCCCGCNLITMIMGIIGCVFTVKANNAYKEGRWDEFKSEAKSSAICLWVGFGIAVLYLMIGILSWTVGGYGDIFMDAFWEGYYGADYDDYNDDYDYDYDYDYDDYDFDYNYDYDTETEETEETEDTGAEPLNVIPGTGFEDPSITINGITVTLPLTYPELQELGFYIDVEDEEYIANKNEYYYPEMYGPDGEEVGYVYIGNATESPLALKDGVVFGFWFSSSDFYNGLEISFANGLTEKATSEDFMTAYGEPDYDYESDSSDYQSYQWYNHSEIYEDMTENSLSVEFWDGELDDLDIMYIGWE